MRTRTTTLVLSTLAALLFLNANQSCEPVRLLATCDDERPARMAVCAVPDALPVDCLAFDDPLLVAASGSVLAMGAAEVGGDCFQDRTMTSNAGDLAADEERLVFRVRDAGGATYVVGVEGPRLPFALARGDTLQVDFSLVKGGWYPDVGHLALRDESGTLLYWYGRGEHAHDLVAPAGVTVARGDADCSDRDSCGTIVGYTIDLSIDGEDVSVPYGGSATVAGYEVVHGAGEEGEESTYSTCMD